MAAQHIEYRALTRITIGAVGPPGQRVFLLQASDGSQMITLKLEKEQAIMLAHRVQELLDELIEKHPRKPSALDQPLASDLMLHEPMDPLFAAGQMGLGYDEEQDKVVLVVQEQVLDESQDPSIARLWSTRPQMAALSSHVLEVAEQGGRPICPLCNRPKDPDFHFCPRTNGHERLREI
jgi:uncharacterized repeat protein (TIGR03847 family)